MQPMRAALDKQPYFRSKMRIERVIDDSRGRFRTPSLVNEARLASGRGHLGPNTSQVRAKSEPSQSEVRAKEDQGRKCSLGALLEGYGLSDYRVILPTLT